MATDYIVGMIECEEIKAGSIRVVRAQSADEAGIIYRHFIIANDDNFQGWVRDKDPDFGFCTRFLIASPGEHKYFTKWRRSPVKFELFKTRVFQYFGECPSLGQNFLDAYLADIDDPTCANMPQELYEFVAVREMRAEHIAVAPVDWLTAALERPKLSF
ncbi:hypothetical protein [Noviherbaspirillum denitrificans]|uniref:Uncharacterized protein n=1 Tax=Noviherbaspirillum denitrificans TaxID=1968433 RepID=A0A254TJG6_9BURK|nr:hypothetical protein [Noviherbaspirillum denitrificans]OWW22347.1 hypothetical protein AYR66_25480 [Noviherbaspirillum denitrificans]